MLKRIDSIRFGLDEYPIRWVTSDEMEELTSEVEVAGRSVGFIQITGERILLLDRKLLNDPAQCFEILLHEARHAIRVEIGDALPDNDAEESATQRGSKMEAMMLVQSGFVDLSELIVAGERLVKRGRNSGSKSVGSGQGNATEL